MSKNDSGPYQLFMLALCVYALGALALETTVPLDIEMAQILTYADLAVCGLFFVDFLHSLVRAESKWKYLARWGWIDLLSSIPTIDALRWGRLARVMRILRVLRGVRATKIVASFILAKRDQGAFFAAVLVTMLLIVSCSMAVLQFEQDSAGNIKTAENAVWWAIVTITTVGYGDCFPVTSEGRVIAVILMFAGVGLLGTLSGLLAAWFVAPGEQQQENELADLRCELAEIKTCLRAIESRLGAGERPSPAASGSGPA
jgi:voltage-gated potassium channel